MLTGIVVLNKRAGLSSSQAMLEVKRKLGAEKAGYAGTIDPNYTGVLPVLLGKAVKLTEMLSTSSKTYVGKMKFHRSVSELEVKKLFKGFTGVIKQVPPRRSSVKRQERERRIASLQLISLKNQVAEFEVKCQHGTYVRKLAHDIGLKTGGAHLFDLMRTQSGPFTLAQAKFIEEITEASVFPAEFGVRHLPAVFVDDGVIGPLQHGSPVYAPGILRLEGDFKPLCSVAIKSSKSELVALGVAALGSKDIKTAKKGIAIKTDFVLI